MRRSDLESGIIRSWGFFENSGVAETLSNPSSLLVCDDFRETALRTDAHHVEIYLCGLKSQNYNILLNDYSFIQYSWEKDEHYRYAFYPNPFGSRSPEGRINFLKKRKMVTEGIISEEEFLTLLDESQNEGFIPILRYENSPEQYDEFAHPCSHLHIGTHGENRWAFQRALSPLAFSMLVVKQYYPDEWKVFGEDATDSEYKNRFERALVFERENSCRILHPHHFSDFEERSFFIR